LRGVDWASEKHDVLIEDPAGQELLAETLVHDEDGVSALCAALVCFDVEVVAIERPDGLLVDRLLEAGVRVLALHPNQVKAARDRFRASGGKSDQLDRFVLCELARTTAIASGCWSPSQTTPRRCERWSGPGGLGRCSAGPGGFALWRLLRSMGIACDVVAPSLVAVRAGDRVRTDRRDAKKLVTLYRGGLLRFLAPPTPETEGLRDLLRGRDDIRCARTAARQRISKELLRHALIFGEGKKSWTKPHLAWVHRQRLGDPLAHAALEQMLIHLDGIDRQLATLDARLEQIARDARWGWQVDRLRAFRALHTLTALGLIAELGDFARFGHPRELASWLGITPSEYSSGEQQHRGDITKSGNRQARRLLVQAARHYRHAPRRPGRAGTQRPCVASADPTVPATAPSRPAGQALHRRDRRRRPRTGGVPLGRDDRATRARGDPRRLSNPTPPDRRSGDRR